MAGWLGANFSSQLDQLKKGVSQVSNIVKDTLVVDETWDKEVDENGDIIDRVDVDGPALAAASVPKNSMEQQLAEECKRLEDLRMVSTLVVSIG